MIGEVDKVEVIGFVLGEDWVTETSGEVVSSRRFAGLELGHFEDECSLVAAGEGVAHPLSAVSYAATIYAFGRRDGVGVPCSGGVCGFGNRDIDWFQLFFVPWIPEIEPEDSIIGIEEEFGVDSSIEFGLGDTLDELARFVEDHEAVVGCFEDMVATNCDLGIHLAISIY